MQLANQLVPMCSAVLQKVCSAPACLSNTKLVGEGRERRGRQRGRERTRGKPYDISADGCVSGRYATRRPSCSKRWCSKCWLCSHRTVTVCWLCKHAPTGVQCARSLSHLAARPFWPDSNCQPIWSTQRAQSLYRKSRRLSCSATVRTSAEERSGRPSAWEPSRASRSMLCRNCICWLIRWESSPWSIS